MIVELDNYKLRVKFFYENNHQIPTVLTKQIKGKEYRFTREKKPSKTTCLIEIYNLQGDFVDQLAGVSICSTNDQFTKAKGRVNALAKALNTSTSRNWYQSRVIENKDSIWEQYRAEMKFPNQRKLTTKTNADQS